MILSKKQDPFGLLAGDEVKIHLDHIASNSEPFLAIVTEVIDRAEMGYSPMIHYSDADGDWDEELDVPKGCDISFVTEVTSRFPRHLVHRARKRNIFAIEMEQERAEGRYLGYDKVSRGIYRGSLHNLTLLALASAKDALDRPLCDERLERMWDNSGHPGLVKPPSEDDLLFFIDDRLQVRWKVFKSWVLQNRYRLMSSRKEVIKAGIEANEAMWADLEHDIMDY